MDRIKWNERSMSLRSLVDNNVIAKPVLVLMGDRMVVVGEKIQGEFILASPCQTNGDRRQPISQEILISSRNPAIWKINSKSTSKSEGAIHRLSIKDIESIYKQDFEHQRSTPRTFICTREVDAFELHVQNNDSSIVNGQRAERKFKRIEANVEFEIKHIGEVEYTPSEGEITSQDYVTLPRARSESFVNFFLPGLIGKQQKIRNRALRSICCLTKNETPERRFFLEVNEQSCDIRPIASEGSMELRYLQSTKNLFEYLLNFGNDTTLFVKLMRGEIPSRAIEYHGHLAFRGIVTGERIPICTVDDLELSLINPDVPIRVKLPVNDSTLRSNAEIRAAEHQCAQFSLALFSRHESEFFINVENDRTVCRYFSGENRNSLQQKPKTENYQTSNSNRNYKKPNEEYFQSSTDKNYKRPTDNVYQSSNSSRNYKKTTETTYHNSEPSKSYKKPAETTYQTGDGPKNYQKPAETVYHSGDTSKNYRKPAETTYQTGEPSKSYKKPTDELYQSSRTPLRGYSSEAQRASTKFDGKYSKSSNYDEKKDLPSVSHAASDKLYRNASKTPVKYVEMGSRFDPLSRSNYNEGKSSNSYF